MKAHPISSFRYLDVSNFRSGFLAWLKEARKQIEEGDPVGDPPSMDPTVAALHNYGLYMSDSVRLSLMRKPNPRALISAKELYPGINSAADAGAVYGVYATGYVYCDPEHDFFGPDVMEQLRRGFDALSLIETTKYPSLDKETIDNLDPKTAVGLLLLPRQQNGDYFTTIRTMLPLIIGAAHFYVEDGGSDSEPGSDSDSDSDSEFEYFSHGTVLKSKPKINETVQDSSHFQIFEGEDATEAGNNCYVTEDIVDSDILSQMCSFDAVIPVYPKEDEDEDEDEDSKKYDPDKDPFLKIVKYWDNSTNEIVELAELTVAIPLVRAIACMLEGLRSYKAGDLDVTKPRKRPGVSREDLSHVPVKHEWMSALIKAFDNVILKDNKLFTRNSGLRVVEFRPPGYKPKPVDNGLTTSEPGENWGTGNTMVEFEVPEPDPMQAPHMFLEYTEGESGIYPVSKGRLYALPFAYIAEWLSILHTSASVPVFPDAFTALGVPSVDDEYEIEASNAPTTLDPVPYTRTSYELKWERTNTEVGNGTMTITYERKLEEVTKKYEAFSGTFIEQEYEKSYAMVRKEIYGVEPPEGVDKDTYVPSPDHLVSEEESEYKMVKETVKLATTGGPTIYRAHYTGGQSWNIRYEQLFNGSTNAAFIYSGISGLPHPWLDQTIDLRVGYRDEIVTEYKDGSIERKAKIRYKTITLSPVKLEDAVVTSNFDGPAVCLEYVDNGWISDMNSNSFSIEVDPETVKACYTRTQRLEVGTLDGGVFEFTVK